MNKLRLICFCLLGSINLASSQSSNILPTVFQTGAYEKEYEQLVVDHNAMLLTVCDNSMDKAYLLWTNMLRDIESKAEEQGYDIKGVKIWINAFWNKDGGIDHIVFYPKPTSKNIDYKEFERFLNEIADQLHIEVYTEKGFSHYGSASFPIYHKLHKATNN